MAEIDVAKKGSILLSDYADEVAETDVLPSPDISPVLQGLFGEVGDIMSTVKKHVRDKSAFSGFQRAAEEEFGDTLWYLAALCRRLKVPLGELFTNVVNSGQFKIFSAASDYVDGAVAHVAMPAQSESIDATLANLGRSAAALFDGTPDQGRLEAFATAYLDALNAAKLSFADIARGNAKKSRGAFLEPRQSDLIDFDADFPPEEQLPRQFKIRINQRATGRSYLQWNGVFIGDPLTDNIADPDGYRFHDVFHFAYAAILHWSPVMRALIKHKRKSRPSYDEEQDGGRAIVVEEGLTAWIFSRAKDLNFFEGHERLSLGLLKIIGEFVDGYEASKCPLKLWERAILDGYRVFRAVRDAKGGWIVGNRASRTIHFVPLEGD